MEKLVTNKVYKFQELKEHFQSAYNSDEWVLYYIEGYDDLKEAYNKNDKSIDFKVTKIYDKCHRTILSDYVTANPIKSTTVYIIETN